MAKLSPMMEQYFEIKKNYEDTLLFFRLGDFYEMFFEDAKVASKELELVLTGRDCGQEERAPMCGVPFHSADSYIAKLVSRGYKVAICEQVEDPATAKGIVKRDVVRIVTPGTVIESNMLDESKNNYLASVFVSDKDCGLAFVDVSTGEVHLDAFTDADATVRIINQLGCYSPSEVIINKYAASVKSIVSFIKDRLSVDYQMVSESQYNEAELLELIGSHISDENGLSQFNSNKSLLYAFGAALTYLKGVQKNELQNINDVDFYNEDSFLTLDITARRNLELTETQIRREKKGSLLWVLDHTKTAMGKRLIRNWVEQPLINYSSIILRQNAVEELTCDTILLDSLMSYLSDMFDIERIMTRVVYGTANAKELKTLSQTIDQLYNIKSSLSGVKSKMLTGIYDDIDLLEDVNTLIKNAITDEPPLSVREGGMIRKGYNEELDTLHDIVENGKGYLTAVEQAEQEKTGIKKLKIGYNRVFGYYIEVTNSYKDKVPEDYIRKQTLTNAERYITPQLKEIENTILGAAERLTALEIELFNGVCDIVFEATERLKRMANVISVTDVLCSLATVAYKNNYVMPEVTTDGTIDIKDGRHPVVEKLSDKTIFVPNDTYLDTDDSRMLIITGPNMAGKSTYMRQTAVITLMAQIGSFVPAKSAKISVVDRIFTRVGASDDIASGQSTFMVEMSEVSNILKNATKNSLIILDEIGRGTSTFDGLSIAWAVAEYINNKRAIGAKTMFATHYHEMTELEDRMDGIKNYRVAVNKQGDKITFLRRIVRGGADESYGIEVAALAGVPDAVIKRAKEILKGIVENDEAMLYKKQNKSIEIDTNQIGFEDIAGREILEELKTIDVTTMTAIDAMNKLYQLSNKAKETDV